MKEINLSIIIPHYNSTVLLEKLLKSIVDECKDDTQIIVVDDNSTEDIVQFEKLKKEYRCRVEFYTNHEKNSAGICRNYGITKANGRWLLFCDADDYMVHGWYDIVSHYFFSEYDVIFFMPIAEKIAGGKSDRANVIRKLILDYENKLIGSDVRLRYKYLTPWSKLVKRDVVMDNNIRFDPTLYANDVMFSVKLGMNMKSFTVAHKEIYCVTEGKVSLTKNSSAEAFLIRTNVAAQRVKYIMNRVGFRDRIVLGIGVVPATYVFNAYRKGGIKLMNECIKIFKLHKEHIIAIDIILYPLSLFFNNKLRI